MAGQQVLTTTGNGAHSKQIDVHQLEAGIYFIQVEGGGQAKFVLK